MSAAARADRCDRLMLRLALAVAAAALLAGLLGMAAVSRRPATLFDAPRGPAAPAPPSLTVVISFSGDQGFDHEAMWKPARGAVGRRLVERLRRPPHALYAGRYGCQDVAVCEVALAPPRHPLAYVDGLDLPTVAAELAMARGGR